MGLSIQLQQKGMCQNQFRLKPPKSFVREVLSLASFRKTRTRPVLVGSAPRTVSESTASVTTVRRADPTRIGFVLENRGVAVVNGFVLENKVVGTVIGFVLEKRQPPSLGSSWRFR
jgi:hypothetical protein